MENPRISIVASMYNAKPATVKVIDKLFLPSLCNNASSEMQLILLDDSSPLRDETLEVVAKHRPKLDSGLGDFRLVENNTNLGFSKSYNKGMRMADGDVVLITNDDVYFPKGSIDALASTLQSHINASAVGPVTNYAFSFQKTSLFKRIKEYSDAEFDRIERFAGWLRKAMQQETYRTKWLIGFCLAFEKLSLQEVGYFDTRYTYGGMDDLDLLRKFSNFGMRVMLDAATFVEHGGINGGSVSVMQHQIKYAASLFSNSYSFMKKWKTADHLLFRPRIYLQGMGIGTVDSEIIRNAKKKGLWEEYQRDFL